MTPRNYLYLLKKYDDYHPQIDRLLESIVTTMAPNRVASSAEELDAVVRKLHASYPFVELLFCLDDKGVQISDSAAAPGIADSKRREAGLGSDRSNRTYYRDARENAAAITVTSPYLSSATHQLALSAVQRFINGVGQTCYLVINFNLEKLITFLNGDGLRRRVHPLFQVVYGVIGAMLV